MDFTLEENFAPAKRENNPNRDFIIINQRQAKHYPSSPSETERVFSLLGEELSRRCPDGFTVVIGFAETATAIAAAVAKHFSGRCFLLTTTREPLPLWADFLSFEEEHSHARSHSLCLRGREELLRAKQVILADDEFTTGRTAVNLAKALRGYLAPDCALFAAAFIASDESRRNFAENGIECIAPFSLDNLPMSGVPETFLPDRKRAERSPDAVIDCNALLDARLGGGSDDLLSECGRLCGGLAEEIKRLCGKNRVIELVGTEEFCHPPIVLGRMLEQSGFEVSVHSVTRSPMLPSDKEGYPIKSRVKLQSLYDRERTVYLYNVREDNGKVGIVFTDADAPCEQAVRLTCGAVGGERVILIRWRGVKMRTSYRGEDVTLLLKDITGLAEPLPPKQREPLIQSGVHYSELLPAEHTPSPAYIKEYENGLSLWAKPCADAVRTAAEEIFRLKGKNTVIVSLARAGTPVGVLIKRYLEKKYGVSIAHYSISVIRGRGIDRNAMSYILARHRAEYVQFVDGWTGKGAIIGQLKEALAEYPKIDTRLAVLADPAGLCDICGTHEDIFIPCSCLNSTVSGLFSRTVLRGDLIKEGDFHGAAYFGELAPLDRSYEFIHRVESEMSRGEALPPPPKADGGGLAETRRIAERFGVSDINLVKPGIGETTRVLLRRIPRMVLVRERGSESTLHIEELAREKGVEVLEYPLTRYKACGIIQTMGDV